MGKIILCKGQVAKVPYTNPSDDEKLYSIEEICYYVNLNLYQIEKSFFSLELIKYIKEELKLDELSSKLQKLIKENYGLKDLITTLFCGCDLYDKDEILKTIELLELIEKMPTWEKRAYIGYKFLSEGRYWLALKSLRHTLKEETLSKDDYARILEAIGICLIHTSSFKEAANYFYKGYRYNKNIKLLINTLLALKFGNLNKEINEIINSLPKGSVLDEVNSIWEISENNAQNSTEFREIDDIFNKIKSERVAEGYVEIENKLAEFKAEYREGASNGLIL